MVNHGETGNLVTISSYDGETQGDPFTMNGDGAGTIKSEVPAAKQRWLADDASSAGKLSDIRAQFERLQQLGPNYGYFPESSKSI